MSRRFEQFVPSAEYSADQSSGDWLPIVFITIATASWRVEGFFFRRRIRVVKFRGRSGHIRLRDLRTDVIVQVSGQVEDR